MKKRILTIFISVTCFMLCVTWIRAQVVINEFQIDSTPQVVELFNKGSDVVDISHWYLDDNGGTTYLTIPDSTLIYPNSCRTFTGSLNLNKSSADAVRLFNASLPPTDANAGLMDSFAYTVNSGSGLTYQRAPDGGDVWTSGVMSLGLFNGTNTSCIVTPTPTPTPTTLPTAAPTYMPTPTTVENTPTPTVNNIYLSEVYPYPQTGETEWIELYNGNDFPVNLVNWHIDDGVDSGSSPQKFSASIGGFSYGVIHLSSSMFNNDGDAVRLLDDQKFERDSFIYEASEKGMSVGRINFQTNDYCIQNPSEGVVNLSCIVESTPTITPSATPTLMPTPSRVITPTVAVPNIKHGSSRTSYFNQGHTKFGNYGKHENEARGEVLGQTNEKKSQQPGDKNSLVRILSLSSASTSVLTVIIIFIRMIL